MIITVTMNPALDKTVDIDHMVVGGLNRITQWVVDPGGKGINVSKTIAALGGTTLATGFLAGNAGKQLLEMLGDLETDFVFVEGETRTNTKVFAQDGTLTELNEQGPEISQQDCQILLDKLETYVDEHALVILAGSIPKGVPKDIYCQITQVVHRKGGKVLVDADGELFRNSLPAKPDYIKPNREELAQYLGKSSLSPEELLAVSDQLLQEGVGTMAVSMGKDGAYFLSKGEKIHCPGLNVQAHSTVGAGDAMVAAMAFAISRNWEFDKMASLAVATSAGAVTTIGTKPPSLEQVITLQQQVEIHRI